MWLEPSEQGSSCAMSNWLHTRTGNSSPRHREPDTCQRAVGGRLTRGAEGPQRNRGLDRGSRDRDSGHRPAARPTAMHYRDRCRAPYAQTEGDPGAEAARLQLRTSEADCGDLRTNGPYSRGESKHAMGSVQQGAKDFSIAAISESRCLERSKCVPCRTGNHGWLITLV